jgi:gluconokinase
VGGRIPCALVVMGVSGSGKSTIADRLAGRLGWRYEDGDRFHPASNVARMSAGHPLTDEDRWPWLQAIADEIEDVRIVFLDGTQELIAARLAARKGHFMPPGLLASQLKTLERPQANERPIIVSIDAPVERIVDDIVTQLSLVPQ